VNFKTSATYDIAFETQDFLEECEPPRWQARLDHPNLSRSLEMLIFPWNESFVAVPSRCPHEGFDLSRRSLTLDNLLVCPQHGARIQLTSGCKVIRRLNVFYTSLASLREAGILGNDGDAAKPSELQYELDKLRQSHLQQEKQIHIITASMNAMLSDLEQQKTELKSKVNQQHALNRFVARIMDSMDNLLFVIDTQGLITRINRAVELELGYSETELLHSPIDRLLPDNELRRLNAQLPKLPWPVKSVTLEVARLHGNYSAEHTLIGASGQGPDGIYFLKSSLLHSEQGKFEGAVLTALNITELKNREMQLRLSAKVFENSSEAIFITDPNAVILEVNAAFCHITGYTREEALGRHTRLLKSNMHDRTFYANLWGSLLSRGYWKGEIWDRRKNGENFPMLLSINAVTDDEGRVTHFVSVSTDISQQKQTEQELKSLAYYDVLTGLPNRFLFKERFEHEILSAQRNNSRLALFFIDLDHFKNINDTLGHWAGDALLQIVSNRLQNCLRKSDTVSRLGGDEFTVILPGLNDTQDVSDLARKLVNLMTKPIPIQEYQVYIGVSIGISIFPDDGQDYDTLTKHADTAMYVSKERGRGTFRYFEAGMTEAAHQRLTLENALRHGLEKQEFELYYQPKADCSSGRLTGAEALIRWKRPGIGMVPPDQFIPMAEETGLILPLGDWILRTGFLQAKRWVARSPDFRLALNLSAKQLLAEDFVDLLERIALETGVTPGNIELEVTESTIMKDIDRATQQLRQIRELGFYVAMDDFGTGYSSLAYLQKLPIQVLKIDRSFVQAYNDDPGSQQAAFINTIVSMGHILNLKVVAEGVETESQLNLLRSYQCHEIQGYFLSPPLPKQTFETEWLTKLVDC